MSLCVSCITYNCLLVGVNNIFRDFKNYSISLQDHKFQCYSPFAEDSNN